MVAKPSGNFFALFFITARVRAAYVPENYIYISLTFELGRAKEVPWPFVPNIHGWAVCDPSFTKQFSQNFGR